MLAWRHEQRDGQQSLCKGSGALVGRSCELAPRPQPCRKSCANPGRLRQLGFRQAGRAGTQNEGWVQSRKSRSSWGSAQEAPPPCKDSLGNVQPAQNNMSHLPRPAATVPTPSFPGMMGLVGGKATQGHTCRTWCWGSLPTQGQLTS